MATVGVRFGNVRKFTLEASGDVEFYSVVIQGSADGYCKLPTAEKDPKLLGILLPVFNADVAVNGDEVDVLMGGEVVTYRKASGDSSINAGEFLMAGDALGNLTAITCAAGETNEFIGKSLTTPGSTDLTGEMFVCHGVMRLPS